MKNKKIKSEPQKKAMSAVNAYVVPSSTNTDPNGMYTGNPTSSDKKPVQDSDDI